MYDGSAAPIGYNAIVDAVDLFEEEMGCSDKVMFIHPKQVTQLRKNADFLSADKYNPGVALVPTTKSRPSRRASVRPMILSMNVTTDILPNIESGLHVIH